ncbi:ATP-grasp domain-containing protein [Bacillus andreraoultii]|uniref:ATP-grasp domain-containing protein n=1 Tax=Bacillus andreraoultii TaxID=1499685 RepID=UPI00053B85F8|nr:alpha-L-glutamate ligase [Bacillus andreraoultii]
MSKIYVIHENEEWTEHLFKRLEELHLPYEDWFIEKGKVDLQSIPPEGIFYSRMSASSHTRGHRYSPELTSALLEWLEFHGREVINGTRALQLEVSKVRQYFELEKYGIKTPKTIAAIGKEEMIKAAESFQGEKFITKHNRAGKGLGVQLFSSIEALRNYIEGETFEEPVDGITLVQEYIESKDSSITRCEFIGGKFHYAVRVDTSDGFQLCPADACTIDDLFCPVGEESTNPSKFTILEDFHHPILEKYEGVLAENGIQVAGIEFIEDKRGEIFTYDMNTNTNYNSDAEAKAGKYGMLKLAEFLGERLEIVSGSTSVK